MEKIVGLVLWVGGILGWLVAHVWFAVKLIRDISALWGFVCLFIPVGGDMLMAGIFVGAAGNWWPTIWIAAAYLAYWVGSALAARRG